MAGQIILFAVAAICLSTAGFIGGLTFGAWGCGAGKHCARGLATSIALAVLGCSCLIAGAVA